jgi:hypothetical protein
MEQLGKAIRHVALYLRVKRLDTKEMAELLPILQLKWSGTAVEKTYS